MKVIISNATGTYKYYFRPNTKLDKQQEKNMEERTMKLVNTESSGNTLPSS